MVRRGSGRPAPTSLAEHQEQLERIDGADDQVVVGVLAVVEVETTEAILRGQQRDDLLDVDALRVMPHVDEHARSLAEPPADEQRRAPVGEVRRVERRLEELVLDEVLLLGGQRGVHAHERVEHALATLDQIVLSRIVGAVGEPQRLSRRPERRGDLDALEQVPLGPRADRRVGVRDRAELVVGILEEVRVDGADAQARCLDVAGQLAHVVDRVPGEVQRDRACRPRQAVHLGGIVDALEHGARAAGLREDTEAGAGVAVAPGGRLDDERAERSLDGVHVDAALAQPCRQSRVLGHVFVLS